MLMLAGCGGTVPYGSFVGGHEQAQAAIAADAANLLSAEYAPDSHSIRLAQDARDAFGRAFAAELRKGGYSVKDTSAPSSEGDLQVRYVIDHLKGTELLRVTIYVQRRRLSRAYAHRQDGLHPAGPWSSGMHDG